MAAITTHHHCVCALRMQLERRPPVLSNKDGPSPAMSDLHVEQGGMQATNPVFQLIQKLQRFTGTHVDGGQISPVRNVNEAASEDELIFVNKTSPKIGQIRGVKRLAVR